MKHLLIYIVVFYSVGSLHAQNPGTCSPGRAEAQLDVGNVRARILNNGYLSRRGNQSMYEIPKGSGRSPIFSASLWVGGLIKDSVRTASGVYGGVEFWPGPLDAAGRSPSKCTSFDQIAMLSRFDLNASTPSAGSRSRLEAWPWRWGAPVVDGDGELHNYNLAGGDYPELLGDQMLWWVMNDVGNTHRRSGTLPLGLEVQGSAFAFNTQGAVGNSTFYRYRIHYKGAHPLDSAYVALFVDADLGGVYDDYIGSDTTLAMGYTYNADNFDEGERGYGEAPPAIGISFLKGPTALTDRRDNDRDGTIDETGERLRATHVTFFNGGSGDPSQGSDIYNYMRARWKNNSPFTIGGAGLGFSNEPTAFVYPGDPVTHAFWSEFNIDDAGTANRSSDRSFIISAGPFHMNPGDVEDIVFAIVWSRGNSNLDSVRKLREDMAYIQSVTPELLEPRRAALRVSEAFPRGYHRNYPNPFRDRTTIQYSLAQREHVSLRVYDMMGRAVATLADAWYEVGWHEAVFDARNLAAGGYVYRLQVGQQVATETMVVVR